MPELPEVEHLRRTLEPLLVGASITGVRVNRRDIIRVAGSRRPLRGATSLMLLEGDRVERLMRRGKSLAIVGSSGRVLAVHLGMTGMLRVLSSQTRLSGPEALHVHCEWLVRPAAQTRHRRSGRSRARNARLRLTRNVGGSNEICAPASADPSTPLRVVFRDPRRFGGLWPFESMDDLHRRAWSRLGPDALDIDGTLLGECLYRTRQPIKAALLNQALVAGIGNIYADESLFAAGIHPMTPPARVSAQGMARLAEALRRILGEAIESGGSSVDSYVDANGSRGWFSVKHNVYDRAGQACRRCRGTLQTTTVGQRTTVFCPRCQSLSRSSRRRSAR